MGARLGDTIGRFRVTKEINTGEFCNAFLATDGAATYFMKEYREPTPDSPDFRAFYDNQCVLIDRLNAMGSITEKFVDHFIESDLYYQVKEPLHGISLEDYLAAHGEYEDRRFLSIIFCGIIRAIHEQGIIHQDLKPDQVMMIDDEAGKNAKLGYRPILLDFDWSIPEGRCVKIVGTLPYHSPEHHRGQTPTRESDIFTVGIMLYIFLTGRNPYDYGDFATDEQYKDRAMGRKINKEPREWTPEVSQEINDAILRCLEPDPSRRPSLDDLQSVLAGARGASLVGQVVLSSGDMKYIVYRDRQFGRSEMKQFFRGLVDSDGDPIYQYCDNDKPMLVFSKESDGGFSVCAPSPTRNYFLLNDAKIESEKVKLSNGDTLSLYSTGRSAVMGSLEISG